MHDDCCQPLLQPHSCFRTTQSVIWSFGLVASHCIAPRRCVSRPAEDQTPISDECMQYYTDLGNIRLFRLWMTLYVDSQEVTATRAKMLHMEDDNFCCGWGPPMRCLNVCSVCMCSCGCVCACVCMRVSLCTHCRTRDPIRIRQCQRVVCR